MKLFQKKMKEERTLDDACKEFLESQVAPIFIVQDLYKAVIAGCNEMTTRQHDNAIVYAEEYISKKDKDSVYTLHDLENAYRFGAKKMAVIVEQEMNAISAQRREKAAKLIRAGQQLMSLAQNFNNEAEKLLSVDGISETIITNRWAELNEIFSDVNKSNEKFFLGLSQKECIKWGELNEKIEEAVRKVMKIDEFENLENKNRRV